MTPHRLGIRIEKIFVALAYALAITTLVAGVGSAFGEDFGWLATVVLWMVLAPVCLAGVVACGRAGGVRTLIRRH